LVKSKIKTQKTTHQNKVG